MIAGCNSEDENLGYGKIAFKFDHRVDDSEAAYDLMIYENVAGNNYELSEIQWFISDVMLIDEDGNENVIGDQDWVHYVDTDIFSSLRWKITEDIKAGRYSAIHFTFGIKGEKNIPNMFADPPESNMIWPYHMGGDEGGYHYMKLNGFWMKEESERTPFNFHMGVGQLYDNDGNITEFVQNWFEVTLQASAFTLLDGEVLEATLVMNIENWFQDPNIYNHEDYGGKIMNNQTAMNKIKENGVNVFTLEFDKDGL